MAELGRDVKNKVGHRGKAMKGLLQLLKESQSYRV
jgi:inosine/xanthosine triphosphate pyrophosphatase family protein